MSYTKKKIAIEFLIPDGSTHCLPCSNGIAAFFKQSGDDVFTWSFNESKWLKSDLRIIAGSIIEPIEIIEREV